MLPKKSKSKLLSMFYNNEIVEQVTNVIYLGVTFSSTKKIHSGPNELVRQTSRSQAILNQHILRHPSVTPMQIVEHFDCLITLKLTYGCVIWEVGKHSKMEQFH